MKDEESEFEHLMEQAGVVPLGDPRTPRQRKEASEERHALAVRTAEEEFEAAMARMEAAVNKDARKVPAPEVSTADLPDRVRELVLPRRAPLHFDADLDLHGLAQEEALNRLELFIGHARVTGLRRVLVVTGKGRHSRDGVGVLREAVRTWIRSDGARWVAAFGEAPRQYGGSGAWVIDLRAPAGR